jgi:Fur family transcriptional regulator, ferric uptake regulator
MRIVRITDHHAAERRRLSTEDVSRALLAEDADIGLATVYRVLMQFAEAGLLTRSHFETAGRCSSSMKASIHDDVVCLKCGRVEESIDSQIEARQRAIAARMGFDLQEQVLALHGLCKDCLPGGGG